MNNPFFNKQILLALGAGVFGLTAQPSMAQTVILDDTFSGSGALAAHTPDVNLTGNAWTDSGSFWAASSVSGGTAVLNTDRGAAISLQGYALPGNQLTLSAGLNPNNIGATSGTSYRGIFLGFYTTPTLSTGHGYNGFLGLQLDSTTGSLYLVNEDASGNAESIIGTPQTYTLGTWTEATTHTLSYTIDTLTGSILGASLADANGTENYSFTTSLFTAGNLDWVGAAVASPGANQTGLASNLILTATAVPEPGTGALVLGGIGIFFGIRSMRTRRS